MRWVTAATGGRPDDIRVGVLVEDRLHAARAGTSLIDLLADPDVDLVAAGRALLDAPDAVFGDDDISLLAPVPRPPSIRDFYAFEQHAVEARRSRGLVLDPAWYDFPAFYFSNPMAVHAPYAPVAIAPGSRRWDYELEVAAVIGSPGRDLDPATAAEHIAGFCVMADYSARDFQLDEIRIGLGPTKAKDTATVLGPWLVTADEITPRRSGQGFDLRMRAFVNGELWSEGNLRDLYWSFGEMLAFASRGTTLMPGDVIGSGTVGTGCIQELSGSHGSERYPWLVPGDVVRLDVELLGGTENRIMASPDPVPLRTAGRDVTESRSTR